jgi:serine/threonine protein phosphatase 1
VIAIGDIHGDSAALAQLLDDIRPTEHDTLVILGDVIDRGPDSRGVIERLMDLERCCKLILLMGNHEEMLLGALQGRDDRRFWLQFGGQETLDSYKIKSRDPNEIPRDHIRFLKQGRLHFETDTHIFVHANYDPSCALGQQSIATLLWKRMEPADARPHMTGKVAVVGHTVFQSVLDLGFLKCIDTGCGQGGPLTALDVLSGRLFVSGESNRPDRTAATTENRS